MITPEQAQIQQNAGALLVTTNTLASNDLASAEIHLKLSQLAGVPNGN